MVKITYISSRGEEQTVEVEAGISMMEAAISKGVEEIDADCGGNCYCGTCRVYVSADWRERLPPADDFETDMIDSTEDANAGVRLSCQLRVTEAIDGIVVHTPPAQK